MTLPVSPSNSVIDTGSRKPKTYRRSMDGWYHRLPWYRAYLIREATCFVVIAYALLLLVGLWRLGQGREAFDAWRQALASPPALVWHLVVLAGFGYHAWTWFEVMPKTLPFVKVGGQRLTDGAIIRLGATAAALASLALLGIVWGLLS
jgi:fumarate reductase subunit C